MLPSRPRHRRLDRLRLGLPASVDTVRKGTGEWRRTPTRIRVPPASAPAMALDPHASRKFLEAFCIGRLRFEPLFTSAMHGTFADPSSPHDASITAGTKLTVDERL